MKTKLIKCALLLSALACIVCFRVIPVSADTDGTELKILEPERLIIQLGENWAGVEFRLKTDAGLYPGSVKVGSDGILKLEIGGSSEYILSCIGSGTAIPTPSPEQTGTTANPGSEEPMAASGTVSSGQPEPKDTPQQTAQSGHPDTEPRIPTLHIVLFGGGLLLAVGTLLFIRFAVKNRHSGDAGDE